MIFGRLVRRSSSYTVAAVSSDMAIAMALFTESSFTSPAPRNFIIGVPSYVYIGITLTNGKVSYLILQVSFSNYFHFA